MRKPRYLPLLLGLVIAFAALAGGAHDLWAATLVYLAVMAATALVLLQSARSGDGGGLAVFWLLPALAVLAPFSLSIFFSANIAESIFAGMDWSAALLVFFAAIHMVRRENGIAIISAAVVPVLWIQVGVDVFQMAWIYGSTPHRPGLIDGTMVNSRVQAGFILLWFPMLISQCEKSGRQYLRWFWRSGIAAASICLFMMSSAWAFFCLLTGVLLMGEMPVLVAFVKKRPRFAMWCGAAAAVVLAILFGIKSTMLVIGRGQPGVLEGLTRLAWWLSGIKMFLDHPWLGVGLGNFPSAYLAYKVGLGQHTLYAHDLFVTLLAETGLLGTAGVIFFVSTSAYHAWKVRSGWAERWPGLLGAGLFLLYVLVNVGFEYLVNLLSWFLLFGFAMPPLSSARRRLRPSVTLALIVVLLALTPYVVTPFFASRHAVAGEEELKAGDIDGARNNFEAAVQIYPLAWENERGLAEVHFARFTKSRDPSDLRAAVSHQERSVSLNRLNGVLWWELGCYRRLAGDARGALECFRNVRKFPTTNLSLNREALRLEAALSGAAGGR